MTKNNPPNTIFGLRDVLQFVKAHLGTSLSMGYLAVTIIGMLSSASFYSRFDIDVFYYAQLSDFLVAAIRTPWASFSILLAVPVAWSIFASDIWLAQRYGWYRVLSPEWMSRVSRNVPALFVMFLIYAWVAAVIYSRYEVNQQLQNVAEHTVTASLQSGLYLDLDGTVPFETMLLGTTSAYVFFYDVASERVTVVPVENLASIEWVRKLDDEEAAERDVDAEPEVADQ